MLTSLLLTVSVLLPTPVIEDETGGAPDPRVVEQATVELERAFSKSGKIADRLHMIEKHGKVADARIVKLLAKGMKDKGTSVKVAAIEALRHLDHPDVVPTLHKTLKRDTKIDEDPMLHEALLKAIGQHGNTKSIAVLSNGSMAGLAQPVAQARILGLGNIRSAESVDALMSMMKKTGGRGGKGGGGGRGAHMEDFSLALSMLTGQDLGRDANAWQRWYSDNKRGLEISEQAAKLEKGQEARWNRYWGTGEDKGDDEEKGDRRRRRGDDD